MIMKNVELNQKLLIVKVKLKVISDKLKKYTDLHYEFLETEAVGKIRRYGKKYYRDNYLKNEDKIISDYMKSFLYLKNMESNLLSLNTHFLKDKENIESQMKQDE